VVAGSPQAVLDRLGSLAALGFTSMNFMPAGPDPRGQAERLALEVLPELRALV
jgi:alkanesulfonate monooxygenase SsuD/methylene tetrahydromethanopterin reductase-like flavin-dependent oxidoreductase (luciferase family)